MMRLMWAGLIALVFVLGVTHVLNPRMGERREAAASLSPSEIIQVAQIEPSFVKV